MAAKRKASTIGSTGGPGTATGVGYQQAAATLLLLQELARYLDAPSEKAPVVRIEPRHVIDAEPTAWDTHVDARHESFEMKARPTRKDTLEFATSAGERTRSSANARVTLICGNSDGPTLSYFEMLLKRAAEARDDQELKERLDHDHRHEEVEPLLSAFGDGHIAGRLRRVAIQVRSDVDALALARELANALVGRERAPDLLQFLRGRAIDAATRREAISIQELAPELTSKGYRFTEPARRVFANVPERVRPLEGVMSRLDHPLPIDVVAQAIGMTPGELVAELAPLLAADCVIVRDGLIGLARRAQQLETANREWSPAHGAAILRGLVRWLEARLPQGARQQAQNIVALAQMLGSSEPDLIAELYWKVEKRLKDLGDKRLVLKLADISILAAGQVQPPTEQTAKYRAHAMVCGFSWSYQRLGKLDRALTHADESLTLGESIGWVRNTAFCQKCIGRLRRLRAERTSDPDVRVGQLAQSKECLLRAIEAFERDVELSIEKRREECGECESLLGRTFLVAGRTDEARAAAERASSLLVQAHGKAFVDLQLLKADLSLAENLPDDAEAHVATGRAALVGDGADAGELQGRLHLTLGRIARQRRQTQEAEQQFSAAEKMGIRLGDAILIASAKWERLWPTVDDTARRALGGELISVRVKAIESHQTLIASRASAARRSETRTAQPTAEYWLRRIEEARRANAIEDGGVV